MKACIIFNSAKKNNYFIKELHSVIYELNKRGYQTDVRATQKEKDIIHYVSNIEKLDLLVVSGGDGTMHEVTNALCINDKITPKILYFMSGTVNDLGHTLKLKQDINFMINLIDTNQYKEIDCAKINNRYFVYVCAFGAFTAASYNATNRQKSKFGKIAYILSGITELPKITHKVKLQITIDDKEVIKGKYRLGLISNSQSVAGLRTLFTDNELDDGQFELFLTKLDMHVIENIGSIVINGISKKNNGKIFYRKFRKLKIDTKDEVAWTLDGEKGPVGNIEVEVIEKKLKVYCPK